ncbi:MAG TPA: MOSC domain-containing protein [Pseudonocardia sp.]|jgi:uncharacterized protein YcbX
MTAVTVGRLWHHPVKSVQGETADEVVLGPGGLVGDRAYGFVDAATGRLLSAKRPKRYGALLRCRASFDAAPRPGEPIPALRFTMPDGRTLTEQAEIEKAVTELLGFDVALVTSLPAGGAYELTWGEDNGDSGFLAPARLPETEDGEPLYAFPPGIGAPETLLDLAALHVLASSTLESLAQDHPDGTWDERRFRPNIVFTETEPPNRPSGSFAEDDWMGSDLRIGDSVRIHIVAPTLRCPMPSVAQEGLSRDIEILRTLNRVARRELSPLGTFPCLGAYAEVITPGVIRVGDPVEITETEATGSALAGALAAMAGG